jgi:hypothetical protein
MILDDKTAVFTFFNKKKGKYSIERKELQIQIENEKISLSHKTRGDFNGVAYRKMMDNPSEWDDLVSSIQ